MLLSNNQLSLTWAACVVSALAINSDFARAQDTPVASSRDLLGDAVETTEAVVLQHVKASVECRDSLEIGGSKISRPDGKLTLRVRVQNISEKAIDFDIRSAFIRTDGSIVASPFPRQANPLEGMARGFVGLISLGASEVAMELESAEPTISTHHSVEPGKAIIVEHQLPYADENVVGARAFVSADAADDPTHAHEVRRTLDEQYWKARAHYFEERKAENLRWDRERKTLENEKEELPALSTEYKRVMNRYWDNHRSHLARLQAIETRFDRFRKDQKQQMSDELK